MNWFYESNGEQKGPVTDDELDSLVAQGVVLPTTLVWRDGLPNWTPLSQVRAAAPAGGAAPAPGTTRCDSCGQYFQSSDVIQLAGRNICAGCKPAILQSLQQGTMGMMPDPARTGPAWEQQETLGTYVAARDTIKAVLFQPSQAFATMKVDGGIMKPFWFYTIFGGLGTFVLLCYYFLVIFIALGVMKVDRGAFPIGSGLGIVAIIFGLIFVAFFCFVSAAMNGFMHAGILHLCLMLFGGARRPFEATYRAICYGTGPVFMLYCIPVVGIIAAVVYSLVIPCIALARTHETDMWRAVLAVFALPMLCCIVQLGFMILGVLAGNGQSH